MIELFFLLGAALTGAKAADSLSQLSKRDHPKSSDPITGSNRAFTLHDSGYDAQREVWWTRSDRFQINDLK